MPPTRRTALATLPANVPPAATAAAPAPAEKAAPEKTARTRAKSAAAAPAPVEAVAASGAAAVTVKVEEAPKMFTLRATVPREAKKRADDAAAEEMSTRFHQLLQPIRSVHVDAVGCVTWRDADTSMGLLGRYWQGPCPELGH